MSLDIRNESCGLSDIRVIYGEDAGLSCMFDFDGVEASYPNLVCYHNERSQRMAKGMSFVPPADESGRIQAAHPVE